MSETAPKKVLIISYFFPPCTLTASQRPEAWAKELHKHGYYPIVVSRKWERPIKVYADEGFSTSEGTDVEKADNFTVYRTPYQAKLRDKIYIKYGSERFSLLRRVLSAANLFTRNLHPKNSPFYPIYLQAREIVKNEKPEALIITGNPFNQFYFGYLLHIEFGIPWMADYRDAWTTSQINISLHKSFKLVDKFNAYYEKKWCGTAHFVSSVSEPLASKISKLVNRPYRILSNGFADDLFAKTGFPEKYKAFTVTYLGSLYTEQNIELFLEAFYQFIQKNNLQPADCKMMFPGLELMKEQKDRILSFHPELIPYLEITERLPQAEVLTIQRKSHLLLYVGWKGFEGVVPSKIFEYCASGTPVMVTPADHSEVDKIVKKAKAGKCTDTVAETLDAVQEYFDAYKKGTPVINNPESPEIQALSSSAQCKRLASYFDELIN